jgi:inorganic pyrophosphatase
VIHFWHDLPPGPHPPEEITAVIEIPFGSRNKYELDKKTGIIKLDRVLYSAVHYPGDYGLIPGVLSMRDRGEPDDKILAVALRDPYYEEVFDIADIPRHVLTEVQYFFSTYKDLEGKRVQIDGWGKSEEAMKVIKDSIARYEAAYMRLGP